MRFIRIKPQIQSLIQNEFMEECAVVRFDKMQSGKKKLQSKKEMNRNLGKDRLWTC